MAHEIEIGRVSHYFDKIGVGIIELKDALKVGDKIHIKGHTSDFEMTVSSIQIEHQNVESAKAGDSIGMKVPEHVRDHDLVYKVVE